MRLLFASLAAFVHAARARDGVGHRSHAATNGVGYLSVTDAPCNADPTGVIDSTKALQDCINLAYNISVPRVPLFFPVGTYLVSDTLVFKQLNPGPDDGINVVPGRFLPHIVFGSKAALPARPVIKLAANAPGFNGTSSPKPVVYIYQSQCGEGCDMNEIFAGIDVDITAVGNPGAVGINHNGAQGSSVTDCTVTAATDSYACFDGINGSGGFHAGLVCRGARYGAVISGAQPVPVIVGATFVNQSIAAILFDSQESLSLVGVRIELSASATGGAAIIGDSQGMSLVDVVISCGSQSQKAITTGASVFARDLYVSGCGIAIDQSVRVGPALPGPPAGSWLHVSLYAKGSDPNPYAHANVVYEKGVRADGGNVTEVELVAQPPSDIMSRHLWNESTFPGVDTPDTADARRDCGAVGDDATDDTAALQACLDTHARVFLPPGLYRISSTLTMQPGGALIGMGNGASFILAASDGFASAAPGSPQPLLRTATDDEGSGVARPTIVAFLGLVTWQHLADVFTIDWRTQHPESVWRVNFESRNCECLWLSAYQQLAPTIVPCKLPVNMTIPKSLFRGLGRVYAFVNDDTGAILSTGAKYRDMAVHDTAAFASPAARLRFYSLNLEHCQSEACGEIGGNVSWVDIYSVKSEGNLPVLWVRAPANNVSILGLGGGLTAFPYNYSFPPDFAQITPSYFRIDAGAEDVTLALLLDHGYGAQPPYWPPNKGGCSWNHHYPFPVSKLRAARCDTSARSDCSCSDRYLYSPRFPPPTFRAKPLTSIPLAPGRMLPCGIAGERSQSRSFAVAVIGGLCGITLRL